MPAAEADLVDNPELPKELPFPPVTKAHILNCSYHSWHPTYRQITPKARLIPLTRPFLDYLRADGIILPPDPPTETPVSRDPYELDDDDKWASSAEDDEDDGDPSVAWAATHSSITSSIRELGGLVTPKLNWSAPKDAAWISANNTTHCQSSNEVYLLLKSSDFVTHDLEHAFDGCADATPSHTASPSPARTTTSAADIDTIPFHLVLRKAIPAWNPSCEFRCFVRRRSLLGLCQRDLNHFDFLFPMRDTLTHLVAAFFDKNLRDSFPDDSFVFDVYIPPPHSRVWLVDINPWAPRTDPLLFSWLELLTMDTPAPLLPVDDYDNGVASDVVRLSLRPDAPAIIQLSEDETEDEDDDDDDAHSLPMPPPPELRLIRKSDPEAFNFNTPQYSAHKLPRDVVDASQSGPGPMREFADQWRDALARRQAEDDSEDDDE